jgi:hypothetical protein
MMEADAPKVADRAAKLTQKLQAEEEARPLPCLCCSPPADAVKTLRGLL